MSTVTIVLAFPGFLTNAGLVLILHIGVRILQLVGFTHDGSSRQSEEEEEKESAAEISWPQTMHNAHDVGSPRTIFSCVLGGSTGRETVPPTSRLAKLVPGIRHRYGPSFAVLRALALAPVWFVTQPSADIPRARDCCAVRRTWNLLMLLRRCARCRRCAGSPRELRRRSRRLPRTVTARHVA